MLQFHGAPASVLSAVVSSEKTTLVMPVPASSQRLELLKDPEIVALASGARNCTPVGPLAAVTVFCTAKLRVVLVESPLPSNATAFSVCVPLTSFVVSRLPP